MQKREQKWYKIRETYTKPHDYGGLASVKKGQKVHDKKVFIPYMQNQLTLPISIESLIPDDHVVRVVNKAIDQMNLEPVLAKYPGGGRSSYNPVMMTKLLIYAYTDLIYSCHLS